MSDIRIKSETVRELALELVTNFSGDLSRMGRTSLDLFDLDLRVRGFTAFAETFQGWLRLSGHTTPGNPPAWIRAGSIWEAQIGFSVFYPAHRYQPYPEVADLTADLPRIAVLGFNVIQLMPRQPYPSYNVHDYWDIATSFGDPEQMKALVAECHRLGMRIILDVLLHGVLDQESIATAADGVRSGPYAHLIGSQTSDSFATDVGEWSNYLIAWSRHIIDFEPYWKGGSPAVSPLIAEHPDWFFRDSYGKVAGIYTKAFDARNPEWQAYFSEAMQFLLSDLQIDGFRFDAPTYNDFSNWAEWARHRAGMSALACVPLFEQLRGALKSAKSRSADVHRAIGDFAAPFHGLELQLRRAMVGHRHHEPQRSQALGGQERQGRGPLDPRPRCLLAARRADRPPHRLARHLLVAQLGQQVAARAICAGRRAFADGDVYVYAWALHDVCWRRRRH